MQTTFVGLTSATRLRAGDYLRLTLSPGVVFGIGFDDAAGDVWDRMATTRMVLPTSPRPRASSDAAVVDVRVTASGDGHTASELVDAIDMLTSRPFGSNLVDVTRVARTDGPRTGSAGEQQQQARDTVQAKAQDVADKHDPSKQLLGWLGDTTALVAIVVAVVLVNMYAPRARS